MLKKYLPFLRASIMNTFIYRGSIVIWVIVDILRFLMMIFLWQSVFDNYSTISGFTLDEMILYYIVSSFAGVFAQTETQFMMTDEIRQGKISLYLIKPINYKRRLMFEGMGRSIGIASIVFPAIVLTIIGLNFFFKINISVYWLHLITFILYLPLIFFLMYEIAFIFGTLMIYTENDFGLAILSNVLIVAISGQLIPIAFYPDAIRKVIEFLPFKFISYPPLILLGNKLTDMQIIQGFVVLIFWIFIFRFINYLFFKASIKKMVVFGG